MLLMSLSIAIEGIGAELSWVEQVRKESVHRLFYVAAKSSYYPIHSLLHVTNLTSRHKLFPCVNCLRTLHFQKKVNRSCAKIIFINSMTSPTQTLLVRPTSCTMQEIVAPTDSFGGSDNRGAVFIPLHIHRWCHHCRSCAMWDAFYVWDKVRNIFKYNLCNTIFALYASIYGRVCNPLIAQLVEHVTVVVWLCNHNVSGSIPLQRMTFLHFFRAHKKSTEPGTLRTKWSSIFIFCVFFS